MAAATACARPAPPLPPPQPTLAAAPPPAITDEAAPPVASPEGAAPPTSAAPPAALDLPAVTEPPTERRYYGYLTLIADFVAIPFTVRWALPDQPITWGAPAVLAVPLIHAVHGKPATAAASLGIRAVAYGAAYAIAQDDAARCARSDAFFCLPMTGVFALSMAAGLTAGIDAGLFGWRDVEVERWKTLPVLPTVAFGPGGGSFGALASF
ncbi:MAG: hypothetical protein HYV09_40385 [Deltaproteobacteria bacterium]|nr:hypothetical protein [Deltaproteobacteria bacterium]